MTQPGDSIVAAVSGGADSVCLLKLLKDLREEMGYSLTAVHVHHGLRGEEADRDSRFTKELCERWGIPCRLEYVNVREYAASHKLSEEEAGRILRYQALEEERVRSAKGEAGAYIATAHHKDDDAETILHNLFRGSGIRGLGGIRPVRNGIIRPLLCVTRQEIEEYLKEQKQDFCQDSTNQSGDYTRNRIRNSILPEIRQEINEGAADHIAAAGKLLMEADAYFEEKASEWLSENHGRLDEERLKKEPHIIRSYIVKQALAKAAGKEKDISSAHVEAVLELLENGVGKSVSLPYGLTAARTYEGVEFRAGERPRELFSQEELEITTFPYEKGMEIPKNQYTKWFDYGKIKGMLSVRTRRQGDYISLHSGGRKTVKSYMIDAKIPAEQRNRILLLAEGSHILWIAGYRASDAYQVTPETETILEVKIKTNGGKSHG